MGPFLALASDGSDDENRALTVLPEAGGPVLFQYGAKQEPFWDQVESCLFPRHRIVWTWGTSMGGRGVGTRGTISPQSLAQSPALEGRFFFTFSYKTSSRWTCLPRPLLANNHQIETSRWAPPPRGSRSRGPRSAGPPTTTCPSPTTSAQPSRMPTFR